jgi:hypothetical protein
MIRGRCADFDEAVNGLAVLVAAGDGEDLPKASKRAAFGLTFSKVMEDYLEARRPGNRSRAAMRRAAVT